MLYYIICDLIPFNVIVWYNSYFHMLYHIMHDVIPLLLTVYKIFYDTFAYRCNGHVELLRFIMIAVMSDNNIRK